MKNRWIALLLACALLFGALGIFAVADDGKETEAQTDGTEQTELNDAGDGREEAQEEAENIREPGEAGDRESEETTEAAAETEAALPAEIGTVSFDRIRSRVLEHNYTALALSENIAILEEIDYDELEQQLREALSEIADAQWALIAGGTSVSDALNTYDVSDIAVITGASTPVDQILAQAIDALNSAMARSTYDTLETQYDALRDQLDDIKSGKLQADNEGVIHQLETAQNQMVMAAESIYITLLGLERSDAALTRSLSSLDRTLGEMQLRYQLGQISALQLRQVTAGRDQLVSGQKTMQMNMDLLQMQLCAMLGEEPGTHLTLLPVDTVDEDQLAVMNLEEDLAHSETVSYEVYSAKKALNDAEEDYNDTAKKYGKDSKKTEFTQAKHTWQAAQYTYEAAMQSYRLKFRTAYAKVMDYAQILTAAQSNLSYAQMEYNASYAKYQQGSLSANALKSASDTLQEAQDSVAAAQSDLYANYITYQWAVRYGIIN